MIPAQRKDYVHFFSLYVYRFFFLSFKKMAYSGPGINYENQHKVPTLPTLMQHACSVSEICDWKL